MKRLFSAVVLGLFLLSGCLGPMEEPNLIQTLTNLFSDKYDKSVDEIEVTIDEQTDHHVQGSVKLGEGPGNSGMFLASDSLGKWEIVWDGNGMFECSLVKPYGFPESYIKGCYEDDSQETGHEPVLVGIIRDLFLKEPGFENLTAEDLMINLFPSSGNNNYAKGTVSISGGGPGNEGGFLATDYNQDGSLGEWKLVWHGNGVYECDLLDGYGFPAEYMEGCFEAGEDVSNEVDLVPIMQNLFAQKYKKNPEEAIVTVSEQIPSFAKGGIKFAEEVGGAMWFAAEVGGSWTIVWDGNGVYECSLMEGYGFPVGWYEGCI